MKKKNQKNLLGLSLVAAVLLGSGAYAGQVIGATPNDTVQPLTQFGFGAWYFDDGNIDVDMITAEGNPIIVGTFNQADGTYPAMSVGDSFISSVYKTAAKAIKLASVGGKDYPVGEPAGIKVINGDTLTKHGKPENCIMTTSYLEGTYSDTLNPEPVICSSAFQTHKRFKVKMLPSMVTVAGANGTPVDLKFKLDGNDISTEKVRYQVFQKINNYTGMRLNGYTLEVLDGNGQSNPNLTLSLGIGENPDSNGPDVFGYNEFANFAHGLWGPPDSHFSEQGFFDDVRAYYPVTLNNANNTISYNGNLEGGNYQDLFGNWVTNDWAPTGVFFDDDNDPSTDAELVAYWGDPLRTGTVGWHKGEAENWAEPTPAELLAWKTNPLYAMGRIEDVLNLGLNYIVEIGNNASLGNSFIIRITPHTDSNQTEPSHVGTTPVLVVPDNIGAVAISPAPTFVPGESLIVSVADTFLNTDPALEDTVEITVTSDTGDSESVILKETDVDSAVFLVVLATENATSAPVANDGIMTTIVDAVVTATYVDIHYGSAGIVQVLTAETKAALPVDDNDAIDSEGNTASSGGGGCTYNPNSKNFDMTFLLMMALGLLYPFRRRFIK